MKINPVGGNGFISTNYRAGKAGAYNNAVSSQSKDEATLSDDAISFSKVFAEARQAIDESSEAQSDRIAEIKALIHDGAYQIPAEDIADSLLGDLFV